MSFIVVHGGAGLHGVKNEKEVKRALRNACTNALEQVEIDHSSLKMVELAIKVLENDEHLNAGWCYGSNLTIDGTVECDAAITHCSGQFGSVGALSGIKNPIVAARAVLDHSQKLDKLGRIPPLTLVSAGAHTFAAARGVEVGHLEALITSKAKEQWKKWKTRLDAPTAEMIDHEQEGIMDVQDTVGAVAFHELDGMAAGVSSGGLLLKYPGRVGEAAVFGAGCWASYSDLKAEGVACSVSGTGEHIVRMAFARKIGEALGPRPAEKDPHEILQSLLIAFWEASRKEGEPLPSVGVVVLIADNDDGKSSVRLWCAFTTASMAVGYASTKNPKPKAVIFRHSNPHDPQSEGKPQIFITSLSL